MSFIRRILSTNPILFTRVVTSLIALAVAFGAPITDADVNGAVEAIASLFALGNILLGMLDRNLVYSPATHDADVADAYAEGQFDT